MASKTVIEFDIDRYLRNSKRLDLSGLRWDEIPDHPLSDGDVMCLHGVVANAASPNGGVATPVPIR